MVHASYRSNGILYIVVKAIQSNIDDDMAFALQDGVTVDPLYRDRMEESVNQGLAYRVLKDGVRIGVMYNVIEYNEYVGSSIYCKNDRVAMMILLKSMFEVSDWHKIRIYPPVELKYFVSMADYRSIVMYHAEGDPLVIVKKDITTNGEKLFKYLGIEVL